MRFCPSFLTSVDRMLRFDWKKEKLFLSGDRKVKKKKKNVKRKKKKKTGKRRKNAKSEEKNPRFNKILS